MARYRKSPSTSSTTTAATASPGAVVPAPSVPNIPAKGSTKTINYIWMPDKNGNLVKQDSAFVKKSFASLSKAAQTALTEYIISVQNRQPTDAARKTVFDGIIDAAVAAYKQGKKQTPWDILETQLKNAPKLSDTSITYNTYDKITSDALLQKAGKDLGFSTEYLMSFPQTELDDFYKKLLQAAKEGGKQTQVVVRPDGTEETIVTPAAFDAASFAKNYLWAKVNIGDTKTIPASVLNQVDTLKSLLKKNGIIYSDKEVANYALQLAKGDTDIAALQKQFNAKAAEQYPLFAERLKANPNLTIMDLAEPYVNLMAKWWEVDPGTIDLDNPDLDKFLRPDGTAGKVPMKSTSEFITYLKNHPNAEKTSWAGDMARDLATSFARAAGFGV